MSTGAGGTPTTLGKISTHIWIRPWRTNENTQKNTQVKIHRKQKFQLQVPNKMQASSPFHLPTLPSSTCSTSGWSLLNSGLVSTCSGTSPCCLRTCKARRWSSGPTSLWGGPKGSGGEKGWTDRGDTHIYIQIHMGCSYQSYSVCRAWWKWWAHLFHSTLGQEVLGPSRIHWASLLATECCASCSNHGWVNSGYMYAIRQSATRTHNMHYRETLSIKDTLNKGHLFNKTLSGVPTT